MIISVFGPDGLARTFTKAKTVEGAADRSKRARNSAAMRGYEVAIFLNVCPQSVRNFTARKLLPVIRLGRRRLFRRDAVMAALKALERGTPDFSADNGGVIAPRTNWHALSRRAER